jgi:hypothetical protein
MRTTVARAAALAALVCALAPAPARADFLVAPYIAWSRNRDTARWVPGGGATIEVTIGRWLIVGGDVGYGAGFFDAPEDALDLVASSHVLTVAGHAGVMFMPDDDTRVVPYATGGFGVMRQDARDRLGLAAVTRNDPSVHFGGGVDLMITEYLGVRTDLRNFRSLRDPFESPDPIVADLERVSFWRIAIGAVIRFGTN